MNQIGVAAIAHCAETKLPDDPEKELLAKLDAQRRSIFLWLLDLMALPVLNVDVTKMGCKNMAIVVSPNLWLTNLDSDPMAALVFSQQLSKFLTVGGLCVCMFVSAHACLALTVARAIFARTQAMLEWRIKVHPPSQMYHHSRIKSVDQCEVGDRVEISRIDQTKVRGVLKVVSGKTRPPDCCAVLLAADDVLIVVVRVRVLGQCRGCVRFIGEVGGHNGVYFGVELDTAVGFNDGVGSDGIRHFDCRPNHGLFVRAMYVSTTFNSSTVCRTCLSARQCS